MPVKQRRKVILWFHTADISQADVAALTEAFATYDVRFRKVLRDPKRDIIESFDAVGGSVPQVYLVQARLIGAPIYNEEGELANATNTATTELNGTATGGADVSQAGVVALSETKTAQAAAAAAVDPSAAPAPSDAPKPSAPKASTVAPPPPTN